LTQICPKCQHVREPQATSPAWQCPACGVAYAKAAGAERAFSAQEISPARHGVFQPQQDRRIAWGRWFAAAALAVGAYAALHGLSGSVGERLRGGGATSAADMQALAAGVKAGDVVMYSTTECVYCNQAKGWLGQNGFAFTDCNMSVSAQCKREYDGFHADGTPFLIVRGHPMRDGFDSDEFIAALKS
jgi:glutaredoxin